VADVINLFDLDIFRPNRLERLTIGELYKLVYFWEMTLRADY